jgi:hypothetical protein
MLVYVVTWDRVGNKPGDTIYNRQSIIWFRRREGHESHPFDALRDCKPLRVWPQTDDREGEGYPRPSAQRWGDAGPAKNN